MIPHYDTINQTSLDIQETFGDLLLKLEAITRGGQGSRFAALVTGIDYPFYDLFDSGTDASVFLEYLYDGRDRFAPPTVYEHDIFIGTRINFNDTQGTQITLGGLIDYETNATILSLESSRWLGGGWVMELDARFFLSVPPTDLALIGLYRDDYVQLNFSWFF